MNTGASAPKAPPSPRPNFVCLDAPHVLLHSVGDGARANPFHAISADTVLARTRRPNSLRFHLPAPAGVSERPPKRERDEADEADGDENVREGPCASPTRQTKVPEVVVRALDEVELLAPFSPVVMARWRASLEVAPLTRKLDEEEGTRKRSGGGDDPKTHLARTGAAGDMASSDTLHAPWLGTVSAMHMAALCGRRDVQQRERQALPAVSEGGETDEATAVTVKTEPETRAEGLDEGPSTRTEHTAPSATVAAVTDACQSWHLHLHSSVLQRVLGQALLILQLPGRSRSARFFLRRGFGFQPPSSGRAEDGVLVLSVLPCGVEEDVAVPGRVPSTRGPSLIARGGFGYRFGDHLLAPATAPVAVRVDGVVQPAMYWHIAQDLSDAEGTTAEAASHDIVAWGVLALSDATTAVCRSTEAWALAGQPLVAEACTSSSLDAFLTGELRPRLYTYVPPPPVPSTDLPTQTTTPTVLLGVVQHRRLHGFVQKQSFVCLSYLAHLSWCRWVAASIAHVLSADGSVECHYRLCVPSTTTTTTSESAVRGLAPGTEWTSFLVFVRAKVVMLLVRVDDCQRTLTWLLPRTGAKASTPTDGSLEALRHVAATLTH